MKGEKLRRSPEPNPAVPVGKDLHAGAVFRLDNLFTKFGEHFENTIQKAVNDTAGEL